MPRKIPALAALLFLAARLYAQTPAAPAVLLRSFPENPAAGDLWTVTLSIDHPAPGEVTVLAPVFPESFAPEKTLKSSRLAEKTEGPETAKRQTLVEYSFFPGAAGLFTLDPFTVITPLGTVQTPPLTVNVRNAGNAGAAVPRPVLSWVGQPARMRAGETASVRLVLDGWELPFPPANIFAPPVRDGVIIEAQEPAGESSRAAAVLLLKLVPLTDGRLEFPRRTLVYNGVTFTIPELSIFIDPTIARAIPATENVQAFAAANETALRTDAPFPAFETPLERGGLYRLLFRIAPVFSGGAYDDIYRTAENLWNRGYRADSLALLRRHERDHALGPLFFTLRRRAEQNLDLRGTGNETPRALAAGVSALCFAAAAVLFLVCAARGSRKKKPAFFAMLVLALPLLYCGTPLYDTFFSRFRSGGVLRETGLRLVPDLSGEQAAQLAEGQPVKTDGKNAVTRNNISWTRVETNDDKALSGWIPVEQVITY